jgi:hypothetical protein
MTKEEYLHATSYGSVEDAQKDLTLIRVLFIVTLLGIFFAQFVLGTAFAISDSLGLFAFLAYIAYWVFFIWKCWDIVKKTLAVNKANVFFSVVLAPLSWIWFYPQLTEPLEIIVGSRMPPTTDAVTEGQARISARKAGARNAWRSMLMIAVGVFVVIACITAYQTYQSLSNGGL